MTVTETKSAVWSARDWAQALIPYRRASVARGAFELIVTFPPFAAIWTAMMIASSHGQFWLSFALAPLSFASPRRELSSLFHACLSMNLKRII